MDRIRIRGGVPLDGRDRDRRRQERRTAADGGEPLDRGEADPRQRAPTSPTSRRWRTCWCSTGSRSGSARRARSGGPPARSVGGATSPRSPRPTIWCARCAPRCWCWGRWWRAAAGRACRCPAAAPSARGRSICTSRGCAGSAPQIELSEGYIEARAPKGLRGAEIVFPSVSVGATENLLMAATLAEGETVLVNAAREPEITDLARMPGGDGCRDRAASAATGCGSPGLIACTAPGTGSSPTASRPGPISWPRRRPAARFGSPARGSI